MNKDNYNQRVRRILKSSECLVHISQQSLEQIKLIYLAFCLARLRGTKYVLMDYEKEIVNSTYERCFGKEESNEQQG